MGMAAREPRCTNRGQQGDQTGEVFAAGRAAAVLPGPRRRTQQRHPRLHLPEPVHGGSPLECRGHELAADQLQSCRLEHPRGPGEGRRGVTIELLPEALEILKRRKQTATSEWVFPGTGATGHLVEPKKCWRRVLEAARLPVAGLATAAGLSAQAGGPLRLHDLRRTLGSWQAIGGSSLPIIGKSLGHADGSSATAVYARLNNAPVRKSMQKAVRAMRIAGKVRRKR